MSLVETVFNIEAFRELTKKVIAAEKDGFWSDWTKEQQDLYTSKDWEAFSRSRGYSEDEIADFKQWLELLEDGQAMGINTLEAIKDLTTEAALKNVAKDKKGEILLSSHMPMSKKKFRENILKLQDEMCNIPGHLEGDAFPLKHTFAEGMYVREISVPKGYLIVTKIHKSSHPCFILKGDCSILTEDGPKRVKAPYHMITPAGTKRVVYVHEDTVWVTCHATKETDLLKIEEDVIAKNFDELDNVINKLEEV